MNRRELITKSGLGILGSLAALLIPKNSFALLEAETPRKGYRYGESSSNTPLMSWSNSDNKVIASISSSGGFVEGISHTQQVHLTKSPETKKTVGTISRSGVCFDIHDRDIPRYISMSVFRNNPEYIFIAFGNEGQPENFTQVIK